MSYVPRKITYSEAINEALREEMRRDKSVYVFGQGVPSGALGGVMKGLIDEFGPMRVLDSPISESGEVGSGIGAAMTGMRPIVCIEFGDFALCAFDAIVTETGKYRYLSGGELRLPLVIRIGGCGASEGIMPWGPHDSVCPEASFMHYPGLKIAIPSTPYDAKGLMKTAIRDDNPVLFFEHKMLYDVKGAVSKEDYTIPFGVADIKNEGEDVTIFAYHRMLYKVLDAAKKLEEQGVSVEVIDPRTLIPLDKKTIIESIKKTGRLIVVEEGCKTLGVSAEISAIVAEEAFDSLKAPIKRIANPDTPIPSSLAIDKYVIPQVEDIVRSAKEILAYKQPCK